MKMRNLQKVGPGPGPSLVRRWYNLLAARAYSAIMVGALFCTLLVKFFHAYRTNLMHEYFRWILSDISVLLGIEVIFALICFGWPRKLVLRLVTFAAALVCTWSVMNAGWLIRTGHQILPRVLLSLFRDPLSAMAMVVINMIKMPRAAVLIVVPSAIALTFLFSVLVRPVLPGYNRKRFVSRIIISVIIILSAVLSRGAIIKRASEQTISEELRYNCQMRAITSLFFRGSSQLVRADFARARRKIPAFDQIDIAISQPRKVKYNVVIVVLEGIQYRYTSLYDRQSNLTPFMVKLAEQGVEFTNARSTLSHTTKALFALLTGRYPSAVQDVAEAVPAVKPYASLATILEQKLNFRTTFFQSAEGKFECAPGEIYNLGFDKFWAREDLNDPKAYVGYFSSDEFAMLEPITEWIKAGDAPFLLTILCSVTHDPYEVPEWYAEPADEPQERYRQAISYTDKFLAALDAELAKLNLTDNTIFCVISDHGEAFGEHGGLCHERIAFDEVLYVPWVMRAPGLVTPGRKVTEPVSSVDLTPTVLALLGFETTNAGFDGMDVLGPIPDDRKVFFSGWMQEGPAGYVKGYRKFIFNPAYGIVFVYDLRADPFEHNRIEPDEQEAEKIASEIIAWRKNTIFQMNQQQTGRKILFDRWLCRWNGRVASVKYLKEKRSTSITTKQR